MSHPEQSIWRDVTPAAWRRSARQSAAHVDQAFDEGAEVLSVQHQADGAEKGVVEHHAYMAVPLVDHEIWEARRRQGGRIDDVFGGRGTIRVLTLAEIGEQHGELRDEQPRVVWRQEDCKRILPVERDGERYLPVWPFDDVKLLHASLPRKVHLATFDGAHKTQALRLAAARDVAGTAGLLATAILAILVGWPS